MKERNEKGDDRAEARASDMPHMQDHSWLAI
jgi:hypothetical protein